jgi:hypothetical protein
MRPSLRDWHVGDAPAVVEITTGIDTDPASLFAYPSRKKGGLLWGVGCHPEPLESTKIA